MAKYIISSQVGADFLNSTFVPLLEQCAVVFFVNFGSEIEIGNQQVWGQNWASKVVINKYLLLPF